MYQLYLKLKSIAEDKFSDIAASTRFIGVKASLPNKLRIYFFDESFLDVWLSSDGDYYHWEHRAQRGLLHRWDNAPDHSELGTFPEHFHNGSDKDVKESSLNQNPEIAIRYVLSFIRNKLETFEMLKNLKLLFYRIKSIFYASNFEFMHRT